MGRMSPPSAARGCFLRRLIRRHADRCFALYSYGTAVSYHLHLVIPQRKSITTRRRSCVRTARRKSSSASFTRAGRLPAQHFVVIIAVFCSVHA